MVVDIAKRPLNTDKLRNSNYEHKDGGEFDCCHCGIGGEIGITMNTTDTHLERLRMKAKIEIGEKDDQIAEQIAKLRAIIAEDEKFMMPSEKLNHMLLRCLRARKYNLERSAKMFKKFVIVRNSVSDIADKLMPSTNKELYKKNFTSVLASRDQLGRQIVFVRVDRWCPQEHNLDWILASIFLLLDEAVDSLDTQLNGIVLVVDFKGFGFTHARTARPARIQTVVSIIQDSYPVRFKELHFINHPTIFNMVYAIAKPFMKEKITKRTYFHGHDLTSLHKVISPSILPDTLGGHLSEDKYPDKAIINKLLSKDEYYKDMMKLMSDCNNSSS